MYDLRHHFFSEQVINNSNSLDNTTLTNTTIDIRINQHLQREFGKTQTVKRHRSVCWQLILLYLRMSRAVGEASSGQLCGK